jgi:hypothetical protein
MLKARLILMSLCLAALAIVGLGLQAQDQPAKTAQFNKEDFIAKQQELASEFRTFKESVFKLKQKLARGTPEEKRRAEVLGKILEACDKLDVSQEYARMQDFLKDAKIQTTDDAEKLRAQSDEIARRLQQIYDMFDNNGSDLSAERLKELKKIHEMLIQAIAKQEMVKAITEMGKTDPKELKDNQNAVTKETKKIVDEIGKHLDKDGKGGEAADMKGKNKEGGKGEGKKGESKDLGKAKSGPQGESKDAGKDSKEAKGAAKSGEKSGDKGPQDNPKKDGDPKAGSKSGEKSGADSKEAGAKKDGGAKGSEGSAKDNKSGDKKGQEGASKDSGAKSGSKDAPKGEAKSGNENKTDKQLGKKESPGNAKTGEKTEDSKKSGTKEAKENSNPKENDSKDSKSGEAKSGQSKESPDSKQGEAKSGKESKGQGQAKDGGSPSPGGNPMDSPPQSAQKGDGQSPPPGGGKKKDDEVTQTQKKLQEAGYPQSEAEKKIAEKQTEKAVKQQADALEKMREAQKKLERLLKQLREEELERVLADLRARCEKMLAMQIDVLAGTENTAVAIGKNSDKKPDTGNKKSALRLSDEEKKIVAEADKCIGILEAEGSAVAFPEVFQQVRQDMRHVEKRLELTDVHEVTQTIEKDIIENLKEMIAALKNAEKELKDEKQKPSQGDGKSGQPGDKKLLELIQELKMIRSLQKRVNDRTELYGRRYPGEQAGERQIIEELRNLSGRQYRIQEIVIRLSRGDNK